MDIADMTLAEVQAELRTVTGTLCRSNEELLRRQALWLRLDHLIRNGSVTAQPCKAEQCNAEQAEHKHCSTTTSL
jgi:hypothetical protein